jgi:hypothetical protein
MQYFLRLYSPPLINVNSNPSGNGTFKDFSNSAQKNSQAKKVTVAVMSQLSPPANFKYSKIVNGTA